MRIDKIDIYKTLNEPLLPSLSPLPCMPALYQLYHLNSNSCRHILNTAAAAAKCARVPSE